jgi:hypothetical protein
VLVERGNAHVRQLGQLFDVHGLGEIGAHPSHCFCDFVHTGFGKAVALGTEDGVVETQDDFGQTQTVPVPPDEETLRRISSETGGEFFASTSEAELVSVYEDLGSSLGFVEEEQEVTVAFVAAAVALLAAGGTLSVLWFHRLP